MPENVAREFAEKGATRVKELYEKAASCRQGLHCGHGADLFHRLEGRRGF